LRCDNDRRVIYNRLYSGHNDSVFTVNKIKGAMMKYKVEFYANGELQVTTELEPENIIKITEFIKAIK